MVVSAFAYLGETLVSVSLKYEKGGRAAAVRYTMIVYGILGDLIYFKLPVFYTDYIGAVLIVGSFLLVAYLRARNIIS